MTKATKAAGSITVEMAAAYQDSTVNLSGADPDEAVVINIARPGAGTEQVNVQTDGTGAVTVTFVPNSAGTYTVWATSTAHTDDVADAVTATI